MSVVTNLIILPSHEDEVLPAYSEYKGSWLEYVQDKLKEEHQGPLVRVDSQAGGGKSMERDVWLCAFNYFGPLSIHEVLDGAPWKNSIDTRVLIHGQDADTWQVYRIGDWNDAIVRDEPGY